MNKSINEDQKTDFVLLSCSNCQRNGAVVIVLVVIIVIAAAAVEFKIFLSSLSQNIIIPVLVKVFG
jgi:hypothetical protein